MVKGIFFVTNRITTTFDTTDRRSFCRVCMTIILYLHEVRSITESTVDVDNGMDVS